MFWLIAWFNRLGYAVMKFSLHPKQIFVLILAMLLAIASYLIPLPQQSSHSLTTPNSPELRDLAPIRPSKLGLAQG
jgi:hypothetical protein